MIQLVLASQSPARLDTLKRAGIDPLVIVSGVDEERILAKAKEEHGDLKPAAQVTTLAQAKAEAVAREIVAGGIGRFLGPEGGLVLGCDSMLLLDGQMVGKPGSPQEAAARIRQQSGRDADLLTGHWIVDLRAERNTALPPSFGAASRTLVRFSELTEEEIAAYVSSGEPLQVAGAFTIDGLGGPFVDGIDGDPHGVVGLSLPLLRSLLTPIGVPIFSLWRPGTAVHRA